jgi:GNAT superfamily N-acetyltransferase
MVSRAQQLPIIIRALTPECWDSVRDLFDNQGPCGRCWCMYFRIGSLYRKRSADENRADFRQIVENGPPPGLLAFVDDQAVGWCQLTPRADLPWLDHQWRLRTVDSTPVWSISCLYIRLGFRRKGITSALIAAALKAAKRAGAPALEAYPLDAALTPSASSTGFATTFERAGFKTVVRRSPERPIMRHDLKGVRP